MTPLKYLWIFLFCALPLYGQQKREVINLETLSERARLLASAPYEAPKKKIPEELIKLTYDDYRNIRFRPSEALWWNSEIPFHVEFFHPGHIHQDLIEVYEITNTHSQKIPFLRQAFKYEKSNYDPGLLSQPGGYAGIRVRYPVNDPKVFDELVVFQGASYFRALGKNQVYGLSLRGISMNTIGDSEDFPRFTKLWLKKPEPDSKTLTIFALLEGENITGAYEFELIPNGRTRIDVRADLYYRGDSREQVGFAPMTSMFAFGENTKMKHNDWRPEVHDSDGLLIHSDQEWTWHALDNIEGRNVKFFPAGKLNGFGLLQRDRAYANYKDLEAAYEKRPTAWIEPRRHWKNGAVVLYTFHTANETVDNVVAFWKPDPSSSQEAPERLEYSIYLQLTEPGHKLARVLETRIGGRTLDASQKTIVIEFSRPDHITINEVELLSVDFRTGDLEVTGQPVIQYSAPEDRIRVFADFEASSHRKMIDLSARLLKDGHIVSEKWSYTWSP